MAEPALLPSNHDAHPTIRVEPELSSTMEEDVRKLAREWEVPEGFIHQLVGILGWSPSQGDTWIDEDESPSSCDTVCSDAADAIERERTMPDPQRRYVDLGMIGLGGMGEVRRVRDRRLGRVVAMKIIRAEYKTATRALSRFLEEAQVSAQLAHPAIVPVHDLGRLADGRTYFTMNEVHGRTLGDVLRDLHHVSRGERWGTTTDGWTLRRVLEAFRRVCDAVAYAHARGVLHRDLKPENIMLGAYGEVLVMDWGLAKVKEGIANELEPVDIADDGLGHTQVGTVAGTPAYMSPEQARGELDDLGPASDVYALGALLYHVLDGDAPFPGKDALQRVLEGPPRPLGARARGRRLHPGPPIPEDLRRLCAHAMERDPQLRTGDASQVADALADWLDGAKKRDQALRRVAEADALAAEVQALRDHARTLRTKANQSLAELPPGSSADEKGPAWALQDRAEALELDAELRNVEVMQHLRAALNEAPDTPEAHDRLAAHYQERHVRARTRRDAAGEAALEALLRSHDTGSWTAYLAGQGTVSLMTSPRADARLLRAAERDRRLLDKAVANLGMTPLVQCTVGHGSYVIELRHGAGPVVRIPVEVGREQDWELRRPGTDLPVTVVLPEKLGEDEIFVAPGSTWIGGDRQAPGALPRQRLWLDAFICKRDPVTHGEYLAFLRDLVQREGLDAALPHAPRLGGLSSEGTDGLRYLLRDGELHLGPDLAADGPVTHVSWCSAVAYADWLAARSGLPWRLPDELEWEKAARGVDGRFFPWGDFFDPSFCRVRAAHRTARSPDPVGAWPVDTSPYGIRGMAGNCRDWCADRHRPDGRDIVDGLLAEGEEPWGDARSVRGGSWSRDPRAARVAARDWETPETRAPDLGFRLVRSLDPDPG